MGSIIKQAESDPMKLITIYLPERFVEVMDAIIAAGFSENRCDLIREVLRKYLPAEDKLTTELQSKNFVGKGRFLQ